MDGYIRKFSGDPYSVFLSIFPPKIASNHNCAATWRWAPPFCLLKTSRHHRSSNSISTPNSAIFYQAIDPEFLLLYIFRVRLSFLFLNLAALLFNYKGFRVSFPFNLSLCFAYKCRSAGIWRIMSFYIAFSNFYVDGNFRNELGLLERLFRIHFPL